MTLIQNLYIVAVLVMLFPVFKPILQRTRNTPEGFDLVLKEYVFITTQIEAWNRLNTYPELEQRIERFKDFCNGHIDQRTANQFYKTLKIKYSDRYKFLLDRERFSFHAVMF